MNWNKLISSKRFGLESSSTTKIEISRNQFQRDYDRILFSSSFRRLQNKTQVFPLPRSIFVHNRLTHSLEVASVGRSLGNLVTNKLIKHKNEKEESILEIGSIVAAGCLAHDMGNPPFGHSGEDAISAYFEKNTNPEIQNKVTESEWNDLLNFEGNANALRLLTHQFRGRRQGGFALTYSTLASIVKYPYDSTFKGKKKYGFFQSEKENYRLIANELGIIETEKPGVFARHPLVYLVEAADDICYQVMDLEDAHKLQIIDNAETKQLFYDFFDADKNKNEIDYIQKTFKQVTDRNEQIAYLRALVINKLVTETANIFWGNYTEIMNGEFSKSLINNLEGKSLSAMKNLKNISISRIYKHKSVVEIELAGFKIIGSLLEEFVDALLNPNTSYNKSLLTLIPEQFALDNKDLYINIRSILDLISGMTDEYALNLYRKIKGISLPEFR